MHHIIITGSAKRDIQAAHDWWAESRNVMLPLAAAAFSMVIAGLLSRSGTLLSDEVLPGSKSCIEIIEQAEDDFQDGLEKLEQKYRRDLAEAILRADSAELCLLEFSLSGAHDVRIPPHYEPSGDGSHGGYGTASSQESDSLFPITPYGRARRVLRSWRLGPKDERMELLKKTVSKTILKAQDGVSVHDHFPTCGVRFYGMSSDAGNRIIARRIIFQTTLCFKTNTMFIEYNGYRRYAKWYDIREPKLKTLLDDLMLPKPDGYDNKVKMIWNSAKSRNRPTHGSMETIDEPDD